MLWLLNTGVFGWAVGFCSAKVVSEVCIVCMPLIASKVRAEEAARRGSGGAEGLQGSEAGPVRDGGSRTPCGEYGKAGHNGIL
jgi:hypothetical protein